MSYGDRAGLRRECAGVDLDRLAEGGELDKILDDELDRATLRLEEYCNRLPGGFSNNTAETISIDGTGTSFLRIRPYRYVPILTVTAITIDDESQTLTDFTIYDDHIEWKRRGTSIDASSVYASFLPGTKNIDVTLTWGYATTPPAVIAAEYMLAKERLLSRIAAAIDPTSTAVPPGVEQWQAGEYMVRFPKTGQYGAQMQDCYKQARMYLRPYVLVVMGGPRGRRAYRGSESSEAELAHYRPDA
jgi:hypothetical protein